jgi:hypothetical protein
MAEMSREDWAEEETEFKRNSERDGAAVARVGEKAGFIAKGVFNCTLLLAPSQCKC